MSFQAPVTIAHALEQIGSNRYLLPAIQREFVWDEKQIEWLFDSVMQGYPISSFLFWNVHGQSGADYKFYQFIREFREKYKTHNEEIKPPHESFMAILDGQQRLTSLYIGLTGSYAKKRPRVWDEDTEYAYPTRYLYLNLEKTLDDEEEENKSRFEFRFLKKEDVEEKKEWFLVSDILAIKNLTELINLRDEKEYSELASENLSRLQEVVHSKTLINFYQENEQDLDKALNIFIRINSGGENLDFSDLIMSIAVANWNEKDARSEIHGLVDAVRDLHFTIGQDLVLKCFLFLHSEDIRFKVSNFSAANAKDFERKWDDIRDAVIATFRFLKSIGFTEKALTSKNAVIPIIYYLYHRRIWENFHKKKEYQTDRIAIARWLHQALLKRYFSRSSDRVLAQIRRVFTEDVVSESLPSDMYVFPSDEIGKSLSRSGVGQIDAEFISELLLTPKNDRYSFSILALLFPDLKFEEMEFEKDHMHPESMCIEQGLQKQDYDCIKNLQFLTSTDNQSKSDMTLSDWVEKAISNGNSKAEFFDNHIIPDVDLSLSNFDEFIEERTKLLHAKLTEALA